MKTFFALLVGVLALSACEAVYVTGSHNKITLNHETGVDAGKIAADVAAQVDATVRDSANGNNVSAIPGL